MANDAYIRWQGIRITQLGTCINLFLTYSVAALGFSLHLLSEPRLPSGNHPAAILLLSAFLFGLLSIFFGAWVCINRLIDFRFTAQIALLRDRMNKRKMLGTLRKKDKVLEKRTWRLFCLQLIAFGLQTFATLLFLVVMYWNKLWWY